MNNLTEAMELDAINGFLNPAEFAEKVVYRNAQTGTARDIYAVVDRYPPMDVPGIGKTTADFFRITIANSQTKGIDVQELNKGTDTLEVKQRPGDEQYVTKKIRVIERQDAAMLLLRVS